RATRAERRGQRLRRRRRAEHLGAGCLVEPDPTRAAHVPDCLQEPEGPEAHDVGREAGLVKRHPDMALRPEIVYLVRLYLVHQAGDVAQLAVMDLESPPEP